MKSFKNLESVNFQTAKKYAVVMAVAMMASFSSLASLAVFAEPADAGNKMADTALHHKYRDDRRPGKDRPPFGAKLGLTDDQKKILDDARTAQEPAMHELHEKMRAAHEALDQAADSNADDATLARLSNDVATLIAQQELAHIKMRKQFLSVLTPEQKQKLDAFKAEHKDDPRWRDGPRFKDDWKNKKEKSTETK